MKTLTITKYLVCILIMYAFLFNPIYLPFSNIGAIKFLYPLVFLLFISNDLKYAFNKFRPIIRLFLFAVASILLPALFADNITGIYTHIVSLIEVFLLPLCISFLFIKYNVKMQTVLFITITIAAFISCYSFVSPPFISYLRSVQPELRETDEWLLMMRNYCFSSEMYAGYGWGLGVMLVYYLNYIKEYRWFLFVMPLVFFSILINARTGIVGFIVGFSVFTLFNINNKGILFFIFFGSCLSIFALKTFDFSWINSVALNWMQDFFNQITGKSDETYLDVYIESHMVWPDNIFQWIFGRGFTIMGNTRGVHSSDVGYLNDLAMGGIIYIILKYRCFYKLYLMMDKKWLIVAFILIALVYNIKGTFFATGGAARFMSLVVFYHVLLNIERGKLLASKV